MKLRSRGLACVLATVVAGLAGGCGVGPGEDREGTATLTVSRDFGTDRMIEATFDDPAESLTVLRMLDDAAEIDTRYGGGFIQSIAGISGGASDGRRHDWFFYLNGVESPIGAAEAQVGPGDRVWWDERDWTTAMRVPAVVGSWPEPLLGAGEAGPGAEPEPALLDCQAAETACIAAGEQLDDAGIEYEAVDAGAQPGTEAPRVLVAEWEAIADEPVAAQLADGPQVSGVFARPAADGFELLAVDGEATATGQGLVAALRSGEDPPVWIVTGIDAVGLGEAIGLLGEDSLRHRYAVALADGEEVALPAGVGEPSE